jgi:hypothetical protein
LLKAFDLNEGDDPLVILGKIGTISISKPWRLELIKNNKADKLNHMGRKGLDCHHSTANDHLRIRKHRYDVSSNLASQIWHFHPTQYFSFLLSL